MKRHKATRKADLTFIKEALRDRRCWGCLGVVVDDGGGHWGFIDGDVIVDIELQPSEERISAVMGSPAGGLGAGIWSIPPVGSEVIVLVPDGEFDFQPTIVAVTNGETQPNGLSENTIVIQAPVGGEVIVHDGDNTAKALAFQDDLAELASTFLSHTHISGSPGSPTGPPLASATPRVPFLPPEPLDPPSVDNSPYDSSPSSVSNFEGTKVLKGK